MNKTTIKPALFDDSAFYSGMHEVVLMMDDAYKDIPTEWQKVIIFEVTKFFFRRSRRAKP